MKRFFVLLYGVIAYGIFFGVFCYAVGFVSGLVVPKHLDSKPESSLTYSLLLDAGLLAFFALQHSIMARPSFKRWWTKFIPEPIERSTYVMMSNICMVLLFWQWQPIGGVIWQTESYTAQVIFQGLCLLGFVIVFISTVLINHFDLFGLRQVWFYFTGRKYEPLRFRTPFFYRYVRHPLYFGWMLAFWATPVMTIAHFVFALMTTLYMLTAILFEEKDLTTQFGDKYREYKKSTPMLILFTKNKKKRA